MADDVVAGGEKLLQVFLGLRQVHPFALAVAVGNDPSADAVIFSDAGDNPGGGGLGTTTWGAFPGHTLDDIQSGIGVVHKNMSVGAQAGEVDKVKRSESGMIVDPITVRPEQRIYEALQLMARYKISGFPVTRSVR